MPVLGGGARAALRRAARGCCGGQGVAPSYLIGGPSWRMPFELLRLFELVLPSVCLGPAFGIIDMEVENKTMEKLMLATTTCLAELITPVTVSVGFRRYR